MSPLARRLVWLFTVVGLGASITSLYTHYQLLLNPGSLSFCDINATFSCQQAYLSRYGSVWGVSVALPGALWFAFVALLAVLERVGPKQIRASVPAYLFLSSTVGLAIVLYLGYAAFFVLKTVCVMCLTTYVAVIGLFIVSGLVQSMPPMTSLPRRVFSDFRALLEQPAMLVVVILFAVGVTSALAFFPREDALREAGLARATQAVAPATQDQKTEFERKYEALPTTSVPVPADGAAVVIVKFTDFQCPACAYTYFALRPIIARFQAEYPGAIKYVAKDYPLQPECNSAILGPYHSAACDAAVAVRLARANNKGDALEEYFYTNQQLISPASVREAARTIGGVQDFDLHYQRVLDQVKLDAGLGRLVSIQQTPSFFINGRRFVWWDPARRAYAITPSPQDFEMAIAYELKKAGKIKQ